MPFQAPAINIVKSDNNYMGAIRYIALIVMLLSCGCQAEHYGSLLWEAGMDREIYLAIGQGNIMLFPGVPLDGKAPDNATLVGVIDSGVLSTHPQLAGYLRATKNFTGEGPEDILGHGTAVSLIALYSTNMTNPPVAIVSAKVVNHKGVIMESNVIKAIDWVSLQGAKVINLSLGFNGTRKEHENLCDAIAQHPDVLFVAAAGNDGRDVQVFPASCITENLLSIGASDGNGKPADYSGPGEIYAPGGMRFLKEWAYYYESAQALAKAGRFHEAYLQFEKSIRVEPNAESEFQIGLIELAENNIGVAVNRFKRAIQIDPALAEAYEMLGAALFLQGDYQQAEKSLRKAIDLYPDIAQTNKYRARAHFNLGQTLMRLDRKQDAKLEFETVKQLVPSYPNIDEIVESIGE